MINLSDWLSVCEKKTGEPDQVVDFVRSGIVRPKLGPMHTAIHTFANARPAHLAMSVGRDWYRGGGDYAQANFGLRC